MKKILFSSFFVLLLSGCFHATATDKILSEKVLSEKSLKSLEKTSSEISFAFQDPKKSAHYESNVPAHGAIFSAPPLNVVIDFNFDLAGKSSISVMHEGKDYGTGVIVLDTNKLTMRRFVDPGAPNGLYTVNYSACWPDGSCHEGFFQFAVDRTRVSQYQDLRNQKEVTIDMKNIQFSPMNARISKGTKVIWKNSDEVEHYVNTDAHPSHTYFAAQNSRLLKKGDSFSMTFDLPGVYPYHCSAHAENMTAIMVVE